MFDLILTPPDPDAVRALQVRHRSAPGSLRSPHNLRWARSASPVIVPRRALWPTGWGIACG